MSTPSSNRPPTVRPSAFGWLLAGLILAQFDVRINGLDLLPDAAGYAVIAWTTWHLRGRDDIFRFAATGATVLAPISILSLYRPTGSIGSKTGNVWIDTAWAVIDFGILYAVCTGVIRLARGARDARLATQASRARAVVLLSQGLFVAAPLLSETVGGLPNGVIAALLLVYVALAILGIVLLVRLLNRARHTPLPIPFSV